MEQEIFTGDGRESLASMLQRVCDMPERSTDLLVACVMALNAVEQANVGYVPEWWIRWQPGHESVELSAKVGSVEIHLQRRWD